MAFDFPTAPSVDQVYAPVGGPTYTWDGEKWKTGIGDPLPASAVSPFMLTVLDDLTASAARATLVAMYGYNWIPLGPAGEQPLATGGSNIYQLSQTSGVTIANLATAVWGVGSGMILVTDHNNGAVGILTVGGGVVTLLSGGGTFSTVKNTAGKVNFYFENSQYQMQNNRGASIAYGIIFIRNRPSV